MVSLGIRYYGTAGILPAFLIRIAGKMPAVREYRPAQQELRPCVVPAEPSVLVGRVFLTFVEDAAGGVEDPAVAVVIHFGRTGMVGVHNVAALARDGNLALEFRANHLFRSEHLGRIDVAEEGQFLAVAFA